MRRLLAAMSLVLFLAGCHAPAPSMNVLAPYGSATVPPPSTGTVGTSGDYYAPPGAAGAPAANPGNSASPTGTPPGAFMGSNSEPSPATGSGVIPASYTPGTTGRSGAAPINGTTGSDSSTLRINGMRVNDATSLNSTQGEPINLTQLPDASQTPSLMRTISPNPARNPVNPTLSPPPAATTANNSWQTR